MQPDEEVADVRLGCSMQAERHHFPARGIVRSSPSSSLLPLLTSPASMSSTSGSRDLEASRCSFSLRILLLGFSQLLLWSVKPLRPACAICSVWWCQCLQSVQQISGQ